MKNNIFLLLSAFILILVSCSDEDDILVPVPNDITFNDLTVDFFSFMVPDNGFSVDVVNFNTVKESGGEFSGFAYSNRNNRSFTWTDTQAAIDTNRYSVYTRYPNRTENFLVASVKADEAYFTLDQPHTIEHILVANTTMNYLTMVYGESYTGPNVNITPGNVMGTWNSNVPGATKMYRNTGSYFKVIIKGYNGSSETGTIDYYLTTIRADAENPGWDYVQNDWMPVDLTSLGQVDKVVFHLESSDVDPEGNMVTPPYFCLDGIRLRR